MTQSELDLIKHLRDEWRPSRHVASFSAKTPALSDECKDEIRRLGAKTGMKVTFLVETIGDTDVEQHFVRALKKKRRKKTG